MSLETGMCYDIVLLFVSILPLKRKRLLDLDSNQEPNG